MQQRRTGHPAILFGLLFGGIIALVGAANTLVQWWSGAYATTTHTVNGFTNVQVSDTGASSLLGCVVFLITLALTFVAGILTTKRTGQVASGTIAGLIAGCVGALVGGAAEVIVILALLAPAASDLPLPAGSALTHAQAQALLIGTTLGAALLGVLLYAGFGAGMGALGGLIGRDSYRKALHALHYPPQSAPPYAPPTAVPPGAQR